MIFSRFMNPLIDIQACLASFQTFLTVSFRPQTQTLANGVLIIHLLIIHIMSLQTIDSKS